MTSKTCNLGHVHEVCDKCGGVNRPGEDDDGEPLAAARLTIVKLVIAAGGLLWEAVLCDPCMYAARDRLRGWAGGAA